MNIGDPYKKEYNLQKIGESMIWADKLNARYTILHAGDGSMEHALYVLHEIGDERLLIENMPCKGTNGEQMIGYSYDQISKIINDSGTGLCLDFGHAIKAARSCGKYHKDYLKDF